MPNSSTWDEIAIPRSGFNVRQIIGGSSIPCFWGRDQEGSCLFIIELEGDHTAQFRKHVVSVNGLDIDLRLGENSKQRLVLTLEKQVDRDLFESLCRTMATSLEFATDSASALAVALSHLRRWKAFLAGGNQHLSPESVRGLFAELTFLRELFNNRSSVVDAVKAWLGPERSHQDFIFGNTAVEIKSLSGAERNKVRISSEDQLESLNDNLFLRIYRLSNLSEASGGSSLNEIITSIYASLHDAEAIELFDQKLVAHGYAPIPVYDQPRYVVSEIQSYRVDDDFPRLIRSELPQGISCVAYDIQLEMLAPFKCGHETLFSEVL